MGVFSTLLEVRFLVYKEVDEVDLVLALKKSDSYGKRVLENKQGGNAAQLL